MQSLRVAALALLAWCQPYYDYVPVTGASISAPTTRAPITESDASGELPSTAEHESKPVSGLPLPFFPLFPFPQLDVGLIGPNTAPTPGSPQPYQPLLPSYGPGGAPR